MSTSPFAKYRRLYSLLSISLLMVAPAAVVAHGGGHGGGGGGGHMGGGGFHGGGGSFHGGGGSFHGGGYHGGGSMRMAAPSHSFAPSHSVAPSRAVAPNIGSSVRLPTAGGHVNPAANGAAHSTLRPISPSGAVSGAARHTTSWQSASPAQLQHVHTNLNNAVKAAGTGHHNATAKSLQTTSTASPQRTTALTSQGNTVRHNWTNNHHHCFNKNWWIGRSFIGFGGFGLWGGWGYSPWLNYYPWWYWWGQPSWNSCVAWLPGYGWNNGYYYDYGPGGNVVYGNGQVTVDGQVVGTDAEYAQSAAELAAVTPEELKAVQAADWMALGTFSMAVADSEVDPARVMQLAVSKNGLVSGTIHNRTSGNTYSVQGRVDKETQRLAFTIGDDRNTVLETGIYNLTQDQTPLLCHFGTSQTQTYMLVRLPEPEHEPSATPAVPATPAAPPADVPPPAPAATPTERQE